MLDLTWKENAKLMLSKLKHGSSTTLPTHLEHFDDLCAADENKMTMIF